MNKFLLNRNVTYTRLMILGLACINLIACTHFNKTIDSLKPVQVHESLEAKYITTVKPKAWQPIKADPSDKILFYLPDGITMARMEFKGTVSSLELEQYLNDILANLLKYSPVTGVKAKIQLVGDDAYGKLQATPDGTIIVPLRFLHESKSEDEIAWLLAHELSHIILTHHDSDWVGRYHDKLNASMGTVLEMTNKYAQVAEQFGNDSHKDELDTMTKAYQNSLLANELASASLFPAWQRVQEDEADLLATDLCVLAGYSIDEADEVLNKLGAWAEESEKKRKKLFDQYKAEFENEKAFFQDPENLSNINNMDKMKEYSLNLLTKIGNRTVTELSYKSSKTHRNIPERQSNLLQYTDQFYQEIVLDPNFETLEKQKQKPENNSLLLAYKNTWNAQNELDQDRPDVALPLIEKAFSQNSQMNTQSYPRWVFYRVRNQLNNNEQANKNLEIALKNPIATKIIFQNSITEQMGNKSYSTAKKILDRAWIEFKKPPMMYPLQIKFSKLNQDNKSAKKFYDQCIKMDISSTIKEDCEIEYNG